MKDLGTPDGFACSTAQGINARHQVVGDSGVCFVGGNGFLWEKDSMVDLNSLVPPDSTVHVAGAVAINDRGEIVAEGLPGDGSSHVVVLIPCDENHPSIEGCDYSLVDATTATQSRAPRDVASGTQRPYQSPRTNRYHIPVLEAPDR